MDKLIYIAAMSFFVAAADAFANAAPPSLKICLTGTLPKVFPNYGESFEHGAKLALSEANLASTLIQTETHFFDQNPLAPSEAFDKMIKSNCHVALGFDFTNDLLLVKDKSKEHSLLILSLYGVSNEKLAAYQNIQTFQVPPRQLLESLIKYVRTKLNEPVKQPILVTTIDLDELKLFRDEASLMFGQESIAPILINQTESNFKVKEVEQSILKHAGGSDTVILLTRSRPAAETADMLQNIFKGKKAPLILGTKFFGSATLPAFRNMLLDKKTVAYFTHQIANDDPDPKFKGFVDLYSKKHGKPPMGLAALAYDATNFVISAHSSLKIKSDASASSVRKALLEQAKKVTYLGVTGVEIKKGLKFSYEKVLVIRTDEAGYHLLK